MDSTKGLGILFDIQMPAGNDVISSRIHEATCLGWGEQASLDVALKRTPGQSDSIPRYIHMMAVLLHPLLLKQ